MLAAHLQTYWASGGIKSEELLGIDCVGTEGGGCVPGTLSLACRYTYDALSLFLAGHCALVKDKS